MDMVRSHYAFFKTDPSQSWYQRWAMPILKRIDDHVASPTDLVAMGQGRAESQILIFNTFTLEMANCIVALYAARDRWCPCTLFHSLIVHNHFARAMQKIGFSPNAFRAGLWFDKDTYPHYIHDDNIVFIRGPKRYLLADWNRDQEFALLKCTTKIVYFSS
jgi:hypothetical protein